MESQKNVNNDEVTGSPETDTAAGNWELLVLPTSYVPRILKEIPKSNVAEVIDSVASIAVRSSPYYVRPFTAIKETEILTMPRKGPIVFIYSLPGFGTTSLSVSLIVQIQQNFPHRWVAFINLRKCIKLLRDMKQTGEEWTLAKLVCAYSKFQKTEQINMIENLLPSFDREEVKEKQSNVKKRKMNNEIFDEENIQADLFIDEIGEIKQEDQKTFLDMLKGVNWNKCRARVWITSRYHVKPDIERILANENEQKKDYCEQFTTSFELLPLTRDDQILLLFNYWKVAENHKSDPEADKSLKAFATNFHNEMERLIPGFYKTIGASPKHLLMLPTLHASEKELLDNKQLNPHFYIVELSPVKLFELFVNATFECYLNKYAEEKPTPGAYKEKGVDRKEFQRVQRLHVKAAMMWYNTDFKGNSNDIKRSFTAEQLLELYRVGIVYGFKENSQFFHKMYAEFLLAQFFVDCGRLKNTGLLFINFFFSNILFDEQSKNVRKFLDAYLTVQQEKRKIRFICWARLRHFLMVHYRLLDDKDKESGETSTAVADGSVVNNRGNELQGYTYEDIINNGTILHLAIIEGHYRICQMLIDCFKGYAAELKKFLKMAVTLEFFPKSIFGSPGCKDSEGVKISNVSTFHLMALFSIDSDFLGKIIPKFFSTIGAKGLNKYFEEGTWTPFHFAAMNSNTKFLQALFSQTKKLAPQNIHQKNSAGQTPLHLVLHKTWYISLKIFDHPHPDIKIWSSATKKFPSAKQKKNVFVNCIIKVEIQQESTSTSKIVEQNTLQIKEIMSFDGIEKKFGLPTELNAEYRSDESNVCIADSHIKVLQLFLDNGSDINATQDGNGKTIFDEAVELGSERIVDFLIQRGANS